MKSVHNDVLTFHRMLGEYIGDLPRRPPYKVEILRRALLVEEYNELIDALDTSNFAEIADGIADLIYILVGMAINYGIHLPCVWDVVHKANLAKAGGGKDKNGKIMKPLGWEHPDIASVVFSVSLNEFTKKKSSDEAHDPE